MVFYATVFICLMLLQDMFTSELSNQPPSAACFWEQARVECERLKHFLEKLTPPEWKEEQPGELRAGASSVGLRRSPSTEFLYEGFTTMALLGLFATSFTALIAHQRSF